MFREPSPYTGLLASALVASLGGLAYDSKKTEVMPRGNARQGRRVPRGPISSGLGGMNPTNRGDLAVKPPDDSNVPKSIPRNVQSLIAWDSVKVNSLITGASSLVETNYAASLSIHPQASSWASLFDQWTIPQFTVEFDSQIPPGATNIPPVLYTAIDFDNVANLGSIAVLEDYSTCEARQLTTGVRTMRSVRPCVKIVQGVSGGSTSTSGVSKAMWVDSGQITTQFYAIRSILGISPATVVNVTWTIWFAFRNQI
jgi:hypothetical protein